MKKLAIIGLGLMGGSLGLAVRRRGLAESVCGYARRGENRRRAVELGAVDSVFDRPEAAVQDADFVIFCVPVLAIPEMASTLKPYFASDCIVTDVGSTKAELVREFSRLFADIPATYIGSHPITGSEESGLEAARTDLYEGAVVAVAPAVVAPTQAPPEATPRRERRYAEPRRRAAGESDAVARVTEFWEGVGAKCVVMDPAEHDRIIARTSHLPHLVAAMLISTVYKGVGDEVRKLCGTGFRDTTRIAGGAEDIWHDIVKSNRSSVSLALDEFRETLDCVKAMIDEGDFNGVRRFLAESRRLRREASAFARPTADKSASQGRLRRGNSQ